MENEEQKQQAVSVDNEEDVTTDTIHNQKQKPSFKDFFVNNKKKIIIYSSIVILILAIFAAGVYVLRSENRSKDDSPTAEVKTQEVVEPENFDAILTGMPLTVSELASRHPLAVMIENHPDARPQAGLVSADIVYEAIVEGGITRYMALFSSKNSDKIGPVRSARVFYVDWAEGYNAFYAHVGGHDAALAQIRADKVSDLDQSRYPSSFWRDYSQNVATEHTMFASVPKLYEQAVKNGYSSTNSFTTYQFKDEPTETEAVVIPESQTIKVPYTSSTYESKFVYEKATNSYKHFNGGSEQLDRVEKTPVMIKNLIVMTVNRAPLVGQGKDSWSMTTVGTGKAEIYIDGQVKVGTWKKDSKTSREKFFNADGSEMQFNRGNFWICVIPPDMTTVVN